MTTATATKAPRTRKKPATAAPAAATTNGTNGATRGNGMAPGTMTDEHKQKLAQGRNASRAISAYLDAMQNHRPKRGRKRTTESIDKQLDAIDKQLAKAPALKRVGLIQQRLDLLQERESLGATVDLTAVEEGFVAEAREYSERKGISYAAWRELGVNADVLKRAGISRN